MASSANLDIGGKPFVCIPLNSADFQDVAAIYVILCVAQNGEWIAIDVGQSGELGSRIDSHDRRDCWTRNCPSGNIWVCIHQMPTSRYTKQDRLNVESALRSQLNPMCGKR